MKICIFSEYAYPLLKGEGDRVGGAELQMVNLARELSKRSYDVSFMVFNSLSSSIEEIDGITVYNSFNIKNSGYSYLKPKNISLLIKNLDVINPDILVQRAVSPLTGILSLYAKLKKKVFLYSVASDQDIIFNLHVKNIKDLINIPYIIGIRYSTCVLCQSMNQKILLDKYSTQIKSELVKNIYNFKINKYEKNKEFDTDVLWVGRCEKVKRPEMFIELAKKLPDMRFQMICASSKENLEYYQQISQLANETNNIKFLGFIPHEKISTYYSKSMMLVCTSLREGFPNTFLEAWGHEIPVVSLGIDPDGIISKYNLGFCSRNFNELVNDVEILSTDAHLREKMCFNGREYVSSEHSVDKILDCYEYIFRKYSPKLESDLELLNGDQKEYKNHDTQNVSTK